jgi:hypothetical protein
MAECFGGAIRGALRESSIGRYLTVFGAVPREQPRRQWLCVGRDNYLHIANVWKDPERRKSVLARLRRGPMSWKRLALHVEDDLEYLDEFARLGDAAFSDRLYWRAVQENGARNKTARVGDDR